MDCAIIFQGEDPQKAPGEKAAWDLHRYDELF